MKTFAVIVIFLTIGVGAALAQSTAFTYQGFLKDGSTPASGNYTISISLWDAETGGAFISSNTYPTVAIVNGVFTVELDFGESAFSTSAARYVEVAVKPVGGATFTTLTPRTRVRSVPASIQSLNSTKLGGIGAASYVLTTDPRLSDARDPLPNSQSYIQNGTSVQSASNFNISGNGTVGGNFSANSVNSASQYFINGQNALLMNANNLLVGSAPIFAEPSTGNTIIGLSAGNSLFGGNSNTYTGKDAGKNFISGNQNSFFGAGSGRDANNGNLNTYIGAETGNGNFSGGYWQTMIGAYADVRIGFLTNATAIGFRAAVDRSNSLVLGSSNGINGATADTNVGIGTSSPTFRLDVVGRMRLQQTLNASGSADTAGLWLYQRTPNADRAFIGMQDDGKVGFYGNNGGGWGFAMNTSTGTTMVNTLGSAGVTSLCRNASNEISTCSSSARYKDNINTFTSGLDLIRKLRPVSFNWKDGGVLDMGLVAEEVNEVEPLLTSTNSKGEVEGVKYDRVGVVLVNAVKEQQTQIETLEKKVEEQNELLKSHKAEIDALKRFICTQNPSVAFCAAKPQPQ